MLTDITLLQMSLLCPLEREINVLETVLPQDFKTSGRAAIFIRSFSAEREKQRKKKMEPAFS